jgi:hypothetical protein
MEPAKLSALIRGDLETAAHPPPRRWPFHNAGCAPSPGPSSPPNRSIRSPSKRGRRRHGIA